MNNRGGRFVRGGGDFKVHDLFNEIISIPNLFEAWREFRPGKIKKTDVSDFAVNLEETLFNLHHILASGQYVHGHYTSFYLHDPKRRHIHKATVIDRIINHAIVRIITPIFEKSFIYDSYSSRKSKGTHAAITRFRKFAWKASQNNTRVVWVLKCDIRKFFDSIDHQILKTLLEKKIKDPKLLNLLRLIITSFKKEVGIPLGNLTSQLFSNIYMDPFDQFIKRVLRVPYYIRYADDFLIVSESEEFLKNLVPVITGFLANELKLTIHPNKISIRKWHQGVDVLGAVTFPYHSVVRTKAKQRMFRKLKRARGGLVEGSLKSDNYNQILNSYLGKLQHTRSRGISDNIQK